MQKIIYSLFTIAMLTTISMKSFSQETVNEKPRVYSTIIADCDSVKPRAFNRKVSSIRRDSFYLTTTKTRTQSIESGLFVSSKKRDSSIHALRSVASKPKLFVNHKRYDTIRMVNGKDTLYAYKSYTGDDHEYKAVFDTLNNRMVFVQRKMLDTLHRLDGMRTKLFATSKRINSISRGKGDSLRVLFKMKELNRELEHMKIEIKKMKRDSARINKEPKEITMQLPCDNNAVVAIKNLSQKINIKTSADNKVRISTIIDASLDGQSSDVANFKKIGIELEGSASHVDIKSTNEQTTFTTTAIGSGNLTLRTSYSNKTQLSTSLNANAPVTIFIPEKAKLEIEAIANVRIENNLVSLSAVMSNADLVMINADKAVIKSKYGFVKAGAIKEADITLTNCKMTCGNIDQLKINSKYSHVDFLNSANTTFESNNDQYSIQEVGDLSGDKTFGAIAVSNLKNSFVLTGSSADVKIKNIESAAALIKISNKYAELQLPASQLKNYSVDYSGRNSRFNDFFSKDKSVRPKFDYAPKYSVTSTSDFTTEVGDVKAEHTRFQINCNSCMVGFN